MAENFNRKIEDIYKTLSKGHKKIADYIMNNYEKASFMTAASLGKAVILPEIARLASILFSSSWFGISCSTSLIPYILPSLSH